MLENDLFQHAARMREVSRVKRAAVTLLSLSSANSFVTVSSRKGQKKAKKNIANNNDGSNAQSQPGQCPRFKTSWLAHRSFWEHLRHCPTRDLLGGVVVCPGLCYEVS